MSFMFGRPAVAYETFYLPASLWRAVPRADWLREFPKGGGEATIRVGSRARGVRDACCVRGVWC